MKRFKTGTVGRQLIDALADHTDVQPLTKTATVEADDTEYTIVQKRNELRYTLGPMYAPSVRDAHDEWADEEEIRKAIWAFNERGSQELRKQHGPERIGLIRELFQWPFEQKVDLKAPDGEVMKSVTLPAGTAYVGVQWSKEAWPLVKSKKITGYSMGGRAVRIRGEGELLRKLS